MAGKRQLATRPAGIIHLAAMQKAAEKIETEMQYFYFDINRRIYEINGVKKNSPYHIGYFRPITITGETEREYICEYGTINKRSMMYKTGRTTYKVYTEQQVLNEVYVAENAHLIAEKVRRLGAGDVEKLKNIELLLSS